MINQNCIVTINQLTGNATSKTFTATTTGIRATIIPASQETLAFYPELPVGQAYTVIINGQITSLSPEAELVVTDVEDSPLTLNDKFQIKGIARKDKVMGNILFSAVAVKVA